MANSVKNENKPSFWDGVKAEWNKITWPSKDQLTKQSLVVVAVTVVMGFAITLLDTGLQYLVSLLSM